MQLLGRKAAERDSDRHLIARVAQRDEAAITLIVRRYNRRLYRLARSVLLNDREAEDVLQEAYIKAFSALSSFRGEARLVTWLSRIVLNEALQHKRRQRGKNNLKDETDVLGAQIIAFPHSGDITDPERSTAQRQLYRLLEDEIDRLPEEFRLVLVARLIEGMSVAETAMLLDLKPETVKTRLHRARALLKEALAEQIGPLFSDVFPFAGARCERVLSRVLERLPKL